MLLGMLVAMDELAQLQEKVQKLEKVSGYSLETLTELFAKGYELHEGIRTDT